MKELTQEYLKQRLDYDPESGIFTWKPWSLFNKTWNSKYVDKQAGTIEGHGYLHIVVDGKAYKAHRLAWIYMNGSIPQGVEMDHLDRNKLNNKISNLRLVTSSQNNLNRYIDLPKCGERYIHYQKKKYAVQVYVKGKTVYLGRYLTLEEAVEVRDRYLNEHRF